MTLALFDQFSSPKTLSIPLSLIAMLFPTLLMMTPSRLLHNRTTTVQAHLMWTFIKHLMAPMSKSGVSWVAPLLATAYFLLLSNLLGLLPYTFTPTTQLSLNMGLAIPMWLATVLIGMQRQLTKSLAHMLPQGTPTILIPTLIIIETISLLIRPVALGVRLTANLTAGHLLIMLISTASMALFTASPTIATLTFVLLMLLTGLEIAVAMIQAYVFILLVSLYLQENT